MDRVLSDERERLQRLIARRNGVPGYKANVDALKRRLAEVEAKIANGG